MLLMTTTPAIEGRSVKTYLGIVSGDSAAEFDWSAGKGEQVGHDARWRAMEQMSARAQKLGASAIVGVAFNLEAVGPERTLVTVTGTAVVL